MGTERIGTGKSASRYHSSAGKWKWTSPSAFTRARTSVCRGSPDRVVRLSATAQLSPGTHWGAFTGFASKHSNAR
jgi:hypothetical protein